MAGYVAYEAGTFLYFPPGKDNPTDVTIDIKKGATFDRVAWDLYNAGVLSDVTRYAAFRLGLPFCKGFSFT